jgi:formylglycine-generating enzyme required for sulfatase activity
MAYVDEAPQHTEQIRDPYRISKYPITNAQFDAFVRDGGYTDKWRGCWTRAGWQWKGDRAEPDKYGGVFDLPNHPAVVVSWYEAVAFCNWLAAKLGHGVSLPTEAQWERAARGGMPQVTGASEAPVTSRRYPWGEEITPDHANYDQTSIGTTTAVGIFPKGANPETGVLEMSGNVWEWCRTKWREDYTSAADERLEGDAMRVLRGGSFYQDAQRVRCAVRYWDSPGYRIRYIGFRVVASPIIHDSGL